MNFYMVSKLFRFQTLFSMSYLQIQQHRVILFFFSRKYKLAFILTLMKMIDLLVSVGRAQRVHKQDHQ